MLRVTTLFFSYFLFINIRCILFYICSVSSTFNYLFLPIILYPGLHWNMEPEQGVLQSCLVGCFHEIFLWMLCMSAVTNYKQYLCCYVWITMDG